MIERKQAYKKSKSKTIREILRVVRITLDFLLMVGLALAYELKQSFRWIFLEVPPE